MAPVILPANASFNKPNLVNVGGLHYGTLVMDGQATTTERRDEDKSAYTIDNFEIHGYFGNKQTTMRFDYANLKGITAPEALLLLPLMNGRVKGNQLTYAIEHGLIHLFHDVTEEKEEAARQMREFQKILKTERLAQAYNGDPSVLVSSIMGARNIDEVRAKMQQAQTELFRRTLDEARARVKAQGFAASGEDESA